MKVTFKHYNFFFYHLYFIYLLEEMERVNSLKNITEQKVDMKVMTNLIFLIFLKILYIPNSFKLNAYHDNPFVCTKIVLYAATLYFLFTNLEAQLNAQWRSFHKNIAKIS